MKPVELLADRWYPGVLERWKRDARGWVGYVWWHEAPPRCEHVVSAATSPAPTVTSLPATGGLG